MKHRSQESSDGGRGRPRKAYRSPQLDAYGDLQKITGTEADPMGKQDGIDPHKKSSTTV
jgi:hypothetical protein